MSNVAFGATAETVESILLRVCGKGRLGVFMKRTVQPQLVDFALRLLQQSVMLKDLLNAYLLFNCFETHPLCHSFISSAHYINDLSIRTNIKDLLQQYARR